MADAPPPSALPPAALLAEFHAAFGQPFGHGDLHNSDLRRKLNLEEAVELDQAFADADLVAVAHELADVVYVAYGSAHSLGIPLDAVLAEVHRANMSKFDKDGKPVFREDGKVLKSDQFVPADVAGVLAAEPCPCCGGDRLTACDACGQHSCWAGEFMCEDASTAGTRQVKSA